MPVVNSNGGTIQPARRWSRFRCQRSGQPLGGIHVASRLPILDGSRRSRLLDRGDRDRAGDVERAHGLPRVDVRVAARERDRNPAQRGGASSPSRSSLAGPPRRPSAARRRGGRTRCRRPAPGRDPGGARKARSSAAAVDDHHLAGRAGDLGDRARGRRRQRGHPHPGQAGMAVPGQEQHARGQDHEPEQGRGDDPAAAELAAQDQLARPGRGAGGRRPGRRGRGRASAAGRCRAWASSGIRALGRRMAG